jgi:N-terminal region of glycosyl transferase group 7
MIGTFRQKHIYRLCIICTCLMAVTSIAYVFFIVRLLFFFTTRSPLASATLRKLEYEIAQLPNESSVANLQNRSESFEDTYRTLLQSMQDVVSNRASHWFNYCPAIPPTLLGPISIEQPPETFSLYVNSSFHSNVQHGGSSSPTTCVARHKVAIIVPYRDRWSILEHFLFHTHRMLQRQQLEYRVYVCEQAFDKIFNKGIVMNGCFKEILKLEPDTPCFIMHDVDLLSIDDRNMYSCPANPRHLSVSIDKFHFYLPYKELVGGVLGKNIFTRSRENPLLIV